MHINSVFGKVVGYISYKVQSLETRIALELGSSDTLVAFMYWAFFSFIIGFSGWVNKGFTGPYSGLPCWPHFQDCKDIFPLVPLPYGYSETIFYTLILAIIAYGLYSLYHKKYMVAYYCLCVLWLWKVFVVSVTYGIGNFDYYDIVLVGTFLFFKDKAHYLKLVFILLYFLASTIKIGSGWIDASYFTSLQTGTPIFGDALAPVFTNLIILMQIVGGWFLLSKNRVLYGFALGYFILFHLYSTILVGYRYPLTSLFCLIVLFGLTQHGTTLKDLVPTVGHLRNYVLIMLLFLLQFVGLLIPGNQKITLEGNNYGLYMFEANHQCISTYSIKTVDGVVSTHTSANADARNRCDPYLYLEVLQQKCTEPTTQIAWTFDHSLNGEPLVRIIDVDDLCKLTYQPFARNKWINSTDPAYIAHVHKNIYDLSRMADTKNIFEKNVDGTLYRGNKVLEHTDAVEKTFLQQKITEHQRTITTIYWIIWIGTLLTVLVLLVKKRN